MGLISDIGRAALKTVTAPVRFVGNVASMGVNALQVVGNVATLNFEGAKKNLGELGQAAKGAVFSGVETGFLLAGGVAAMGAGATLGAAAASVGGKVVGASALKEGGKQVGGAFLTAYVETKVG